ncbi:hypothetical protein FQA39_LY07433 [Lamprigera yunnana]|nr:hypothetical protein FQA39_LY07433 [Lamprigera yunnana]
MVTRGAKKDDSPPRKTYRKSPARTDTDRSPSRLATKSSNFSPQARRSLRKSPSRSTSQTVKSPTRSPSRRSPARKSPSRLAKDNAVVVPEKPKRTSSRSRKQIIENDSVSEEEDSKISSEKQKTANSTTKKLEVDISSPQNVVHKPKEPTPITAEFDSYVNITRRSVLRSRSRDIDRIDNLRREMLLSSVQKLTELSDEDDIKCPDTVREKSQHRSKSRTIELNIISGKSNWIKDLLSTLLLPLTPVVYLMFCNETHCYFTKLPNLNKYLLLSTYFDSICFAVCAIYFGLIVILSALPFGGVHISGLPNKHGRLEYIMNGFFVAIMTGIALIILEYYNVPVIEKITSRYFQLLVSLLIMSLVTSLYFYARSFYVPLSALKLDVLRNNPIYNFVNGRELNPRIFGYVDVKMCLIRYFMIGNILISGMLMFKNVEISVDKEGNFDLRSAKYNLTLLIMTGLQIIYSLDLLIYETSFVTTATAQYEAVGYKMVTGFMCGPILMCCVSKYIFDYGIKLPYWHLVGSTVLFFVGYFLYRASNNQKHKFRQNPYNPSVSHLETIPTSQGKKLLVSGYWGWVRHPNYLGDIIMVAAFASFAPNTIPALVLLTDILVLISKAYAEGVKCKQRYGSAWDRYCERVRPFTKETTIHGIFFFTARGLHSIERLFWLIVVFLATTGAASLIMSNWNRYNANPTVISIQKDFRNWKNLLPSVTGCFLNKTNHDLMNLYILQTWGISQNHPKYGYYVDFVKTVANASYYNLNDFAKFENDPDLVDVNLFQLAVKVHPKLTGTLATFDVKHKSYFTLIMTELGICFTVNSKFTHILSLKAVVFSMSSNIGNIDDENLLKCHYLNGLCYARYDSDPLLPINFYIHSYLEVIHAMSVTPFYLGESEELEINFLMEETSSSSTLRNLSPSQRNCRFYDEPQSKDVPVYSFSICNMVCRHHMIMYKCGCRLFFYHFLDGKVCDIKGMICASKLIEKWIASQTLLNCDCPQPCHIVTYLPLTQKITPWTSGYFDQRLSFRWGVLHPTTKYQRDVLFSFEDLVGKYNSTPKLETLYKTSFLVSLGGSLSLFLGISFISLIEIIFFILSYIASYC